MENMINSGQIDISLGYFGDNNSPEHMAEALGKTHVGLIGFLNILETRLGIFTEPSSFTTRLIKYLNCIDQINKKEAFYHNSYVADPFSVARTLLQWRDEWYLAGWTGEFEGKFSARLSDMAEIEVIAKEQVELNSGQRIQKVLHWLEGHKVHIENIYLLDKLEIFPSLYQKLIHATGANISPPKALLPCGKPGTDLHNLQRVLAISEHTKCDIKNDGSLIILNAISAQDSTDITAQILLGLQTNSPSQKHAVLAEVRGELLDEALEANQMPRAGFSNLSPWRPIFQVLLLSYELLWAPLNPKALLQFLSHPVGPIPARIRKRLAQTVADTPGIDSADWKETVQICLEKEDEDKREKEAEKIEYWLRSERFDPKQGIDSETLIERAQSIAKWLTGIRETTQDPSLRSLYNIAYNQAIEFSEAVKRLQKHDRNILTRDNILRLMEDVRGTGAPVTDRYSEVAEHAPMALSFEQAGAVYAPVDTLIWWDCQASDHIKTWPWSKAELAELNKLDVILQSVDDRLDAFGHAWLRPILKAKEKVIIVLNGDVDRHHPIWDQISSQSKGLIEQDMCNPNVLNDLRIPLSNLDTKPLPTKIRWWQLPKEQKIEPRASESYSSLNDFINSPYIRVLKYASKIRGGSLSTINDGNLLKGSLAHRLIENFFLAFPDIQNIDPGALPVWIDENIFFLLQTEGAVLLETGRYAERQAFTSTVKQSLRVLIEHLQTAKIVAVETEQPQTGQFSGGNLNGYIDIVATHEDGTKAIIDIKWGGSKYRRSELIESRYLQLAVYDRLLQKSPNLSYFILVDAKMFNLNHDFFKNGENITPENQEGCTQFWTRFENTWTWRNTQINSGRIEVTVSGTEPDEHSVPSNKNSLTIPDTSDKFSDYGALIGWEPSE